MAETGLVRIEIDPNVRVRGRQTFTGYEDVQAQYGLTRTRSGAPVVAGQKVIAFESESGIMTDATVVDVWAEKQIIYLAPDWQGWRDDPATVIHAADGAAAMCGDTAAPERRSADAGAVTCTPCMDEADARNRFA